MTTFVANFFINPMLRQARRFSDISRGPNLARDQTTPDHAVATDESDRRDDVHESRTPTASAPPALGTAPGLPNTEPPPEDDTPRTTPRGIHAPHRPSVIPEDDGHGEMRRRLQEIQGRDVAAEDKAHLMHSILMERYHLCRKPTPALSSPDVSGSTPRSWSEPLALGTFEALKIWPSPTEQFSLTEDDVRPTYSNINPDLASTDRPKRPQETAPANRPRHMGCQHYLRNVKLQCSTCEKWYTCRFCHDAVEDHSLIRNETRNMMCMLCATPQRAAEACIKCGAMAARYYCNACKLWDDHPDKPIYHCADCGICRRGAGLGKDFFHCKICRACISISIENSHRCIERSTDCDCPICGHYLFTSPLPVVFMRCGHSIHEKCYGEHIRVSYKCPICSKSLCNMDPCFRNLDASIQRQPMPEEYTDLRAAILCNDCSARSTVPFHWLGLKCAVCASYNTVKLEVIGQQDANTQVEVLNLGGVAEAIEALNVHARERREPPARSGMADHGRHHSHQDGQDRAVGRRTALQPTGSEASRHNLFVLVASLPPTPLRDEDESDDDILGFWGGPPSESEDDTPEDSEDDFEDEKDEEDEDEDEEENEDPLFLIGHR